MVVQGFYACVCVCGEVGGAFITRRFISEGDECPVGGHPRTRKNVCLKGKGGGQLKVVLVRRGFTLENVMIFHLLQSLAYISFLIWLCNTVMVFLETLHHSAAHITDTSSLVITQELTNKSHETEEQTSAT